MGRDYSASTSTSNKKNNGEGRASGFLLPSSEFDKPELSVLVPSSSLSSEFRPGDAKHVLAKAIEAEKSFELAPEISIFQPSAERSQQTKVDEVLTVNKLRFEELGLYGRTQQKTELKKSFTRLTTTSSVEFLFLSGESGSGKTSLAMSIQDEVKSKRGALVRGKYDLTMRDEPYSAILLACKDLCDQAVEQSGQEALDKFESELWSQLDEFEMQLLRNFLPSVIKVAPMLAKNEGITNLERLRDIKPENQKIILERAFRKFLSAVTKTLFRHLVIFLDDLQRGDAASFDLFEQLTSDTEIKNMMMICCYRSNEVDNSHVVSTLCEKLCAKHNAGVLHFTQLRLDNLTADDVKHLLIDLLSAPDNEEIEKLAVICFNRTLGNPFFLKTFLSVLYEGQLLRFEIGTFKWNWEIPAIERIHATDNIVHMVKGRVSRCKGELLECLLRAACLGNIFQTGDMDLIWTSIDSDGGPESRTSISSLLQSAMQQGFIEQIGNSKNFQFAHDSIKEAVISVKTKNEFDEIQREVGEILFRELPQEEISGRLIFVVSNLLNKSVRSSTRSVELARLNLQAAMRAKQLSAFASCAMYAEEGVRNLPPDMWQNHAELAVTLHSLAAEAERCVGNIDQANIYCSAVLSQDGVSLLDKMPATYVMVGCLRRKEALDLCLDTLGSLGLSIPRNFVRQGVKSMLALRRKREPKNIPNADTIVQLSAMTDPAKRHGMKLMDMACNFSFQLGNPACTVLLLCEMVSWTLQYGLHECSPTAVAGLASPIMHYLGDWTAARELAELSFVMLERLDDKSSAGNTIQHANAFILCWTSPASAQIKLFMDGYSASMVAGDTEYAAWNLMCFVSFQLLSGKPLALVEEDCRLYLPQIEESLKRFKQAKCVRVVWQCVLNLLGMSANTTTASGIAMDESNYMTTTRKFDLHFFMFWKSLLYTYFGDYVQGARDALKRGDAFMKMAPGHFLGCDAFYRCFCLYAAARTSGKSLYKRRADRLQTVIETWAKKKGGPNHFHMWTLLNAEKAALESRSSCTGENDDNNKMRDVCQLYEQAVAASVRSGFVQNAALAEERYADYLLTTVGDTTDASYHLSRAVERYQDWGAQRKVELLNEKYPELLKNDATGA